MGGARSAVDLHHAIVGTDDFGTHQAFSITVALCQFELTSLLTSK